MAVILLRHTTPQIGPGICYGQTDLDVADSFEAEAADVLAALPSYAHIVSSPLIRCRKLADYLGQRTQIKVETDSRLMEMDFGAWEGLAWSAISRCEIDAWAANFYTARPHGGESVAMLHTRCTEALLEWRRRCSSVLIVTHAGVIRAALASSETAEDFRADVDLGRFITLSKGQGDFYE